jgi:hypothetical protein
MALIGQWVDITVTCDRVVGYGGKVRWVVLDEQLGRFPDGGGGGYGKIWS